MWRVNVPNHLKVAVTKFSWSDADRIFQTLRELATDPLAGEVYALGNDAYYRVVQGYLIFFDLLPSDHVVNVTAIERPH
jgi:hypothetical protein